MKRSIIIVLILMLTILLFSKPMIKFNTLKHDFGSIKEEAGPYEYNFKFTNTGDEPLKITRVKAG